MQRILAIGLAALAITLVAAPAAAQSATMSFFITSAGPGDGANLGGLEGADAHCQMLASDAGAGGKTWRAYLSTTGPTGQNARDRIGNGPWYNHGGVEIASSVDNLLGANNLTKETQLTETGQIVNGRGDDPNMHDILTGTQLDGTAWEGEGDTTCNNWTSNTSDGSALVGHHDRTGGGANPSHWSTAHGSRGCGQADLQGTGGNGFYYCFAID
ncbi:MAG: hypothetical protein F4Y45_16630 [Acidobacteria bacterium]|nr:hypothetical protein [Acidobacteriota bacterium]MXZ72168.1 hypothetical protein [Acidobacteriota bacterium]MYJ05134.1 hypothetical protein [Acidobacteriota bacterium]